VFPGALSGFTIAVTAGHRADELAALIARRGGEVMIGPVVRNAPLDDDTPLAEATTAVLEDPVDIVILSTALGMRGWISGADALGVGDRLLAPFDELSDEKTGVDFDELMEINEELTNADGPGKLPAEVTKVFADCGK